MRPQLEALAAELGIVDRVTWLGQVPHGDVATVLAASDVALAPYPPLAHFPFSPLKLYEYLAAGVPVIASDVGQVRSVLGDGRFGSLVPAGDVGALARALTPRVGALRDAERGRAYALEHHGWNRRAEQLGVLFAEVTHAVAR